MNSDKVSKDLQSVAGGEVEVLAWMYRREGGEVLGRLVALESEDLKYVREGRRCEGRTLLTPRSDYFDWIPLVDLAHVTRLQAEVDGLEVEVTHYLQQMEQMESELTKARESISQVVAKAELAASMMDDDERGNRFAEVLRLIISELSPKSSPAAKVHPIDNH